MREFDNVLSCLLNEPLLAEGAKAETVAGVVLGRRGVEVNVSGDSGDRMGPLQERQIRERREAMRREGYMLPEGDKDFLFNPALGVAVVEVTGSLAHRQWRIGNSSGVMGYDGISASYNAALTDPDVKAIVFDIHSAGGQVAGVFQLADRIRAARQVKPMVAIADEMAFSAAYLIAAATGEIWLASEVAQVGSIGAVVVHFSFEKMMANDGVKATIVSSASQKAEGNPYEDLSPEALAHMQERIDAVAAPFVARMAAWRGRTEDQIRATNAATFMGQSAIDEGLADGIADPFEIINALARKAGGFMPA